MPYFACSIPVCAAYPGSNMVWTETSLELPGRYLTELAILIQHGVMYCKKTQTMISTPLKLESPSP